MLKDPFNFFLSLYLIYFLFAFIFDTPENILAGLYSIVNSPDILITDYILVGGMGAALVNSALVGIFSIILLKAFKAESKGSNIMVIWMMSGYAFFGKNPVNCAPIILGGYLYSKYQGRPFANYIQATLLACTLSPAVSQMYFAVHESWIGIALGILLGIIVGFIINPVADHAYRAHNGFNLYNAGFAGGILSLVIISLLRNSGFDSAPRSVWSEGNNLILACFLFAIGFALIAASVILSESEYTLKHIINLANYKERHAVIDDHYIKHGELAYFNMGLLGIASCLLILLIGGSLSGPIIGGIFAIIGFACVGKNIFNIAPSMAGCMIATYIHGWEINTPSYMLTMLFCATLAPISSRFGKLWGIAAGMLHLNLTAKLAEINGGISLYNNGLAGGIIAMVIVPLAFAMHREKEEKRKAA